MSFSHLAASKPQQNKRPVMKSTREKRQSITDFKHLAFRSCEFDSITCRIISLSCRFSQLFYKFVAFLAGNCAFSELWSLIHAQHQRMKPLRSFLEETSTLLSGIVVNLRGTNHTNPCSSPILHSCIRPTTTRLRRPQKYLCSAQPPEDWCWPICSQHEINGPVQLRFVWMWQGAHCTPHLACLHRIATSMPHQWGGQPCYFGMLYPIKVLTNMYSCSCIRKKKLMERCAKPLIRVTEMKFVFWNMEPRILWSFISYKNYSGPVIRCSLSTWKPKLLLLVCYGSTILHMSLLKQLQLSVSLHASLLMTFASGSEL